MTEPKQSALSATASTWTQCSDKLPERGIRVLCWNAGNYSTFSSDELHSQANAKQTQWTHWRPLPEPPEVK